MRAPAGRRTPHVTTTASHTRPVNDGVVVLLNGVATTA